MFVCCEEEEFVMFDILWGGAYEMCFREREFRLTLIPFV